MRTLVSSDTAKGRPARAQWLLRPQWLRLAAALLAIAGVLCAVAVFASAGRQQALRAQLLAVPADDVPLHPRLAQVARTLARPVYAAQCAGCHGADLRGRLQAGTPDLTAGAWLFGTGRVFDLERTILYGVRAGGRSRNVTEMPAFGQTGLLQPADLRSLVSYLLFLNKRSTDASAAADGRALYAGRGGCADCHGEDAQGAGDYGAPNLTVNRFAHGGSAQELYDSLYYGRHGIMPGYSATLTPVQIRALAVWIHDAARTAGHPAP